ncbi:hypothetical protein WI460_03815 [Gemmatimonadota bacterium Y43]|uniref:hypothetical protein n=1 Tax=Gaopeijia maritima TaxID=3119007 RepID=UPI00328F3925
MTRPRIDSTLPLPRPARDPGPVPAEEGGLSRSRRADPSTRRVEGARASVRLSGVDGIEQVRGGHALTGAIRVVAGPAARTTDTPRTVTRHRPDDGLDEVLVVPERLPGAAVQWVASRAGGPRVLEVELPVRVGTRPRIAHEGALLRWAEESDDRGAVLQLAGPVTEEWALVQSGDRTLARAAVDPAPGRPVTLLVSEVGDDGRLPSLPALAALKAHRRRDHLEPTQTEGLVLHTDRPVLDEGVAWARAAIRARVDETPGSTGVRGSEWADLARGALAAGETEVAKRALGAAAPTSLAEVEALALGVAWTSTGAELLARRDAVDRLASDAPEAVRRRLADAAEAAGAEEWAAELRRPVAAPGSRALPTVGRSESGAAKTEPSEPVEPEPGTGAPRRDELRRALERAAGAEGEWSAAVLERALAALAAGETDGESPDPELALDLLVRGVLGITPDAAYGRIEVAPALPAGWGTVRVEGIALGDARVGFEIRRESHTVRIALHQTAGGAPVTWILAPRLEGSTIEAVRVDGAPAEVDAHRSGTRIQPRLQLPAERERVVEVEVSPP